MIEYINNAIRATSGSNITLAAMITDDDGNTITSGAHFMLFDEDGAECIAVVNGSYYAEQGIWEFMLESIITAGKCGRYWYCICVDSEPLCFKQPFYLCK